MGRYCGDLTLAAAIAGGCVSFIVVPKLNLTRRSAAKSKPIAKRKTRYASLATEHMCDAGRAGALFIEKETGRETRATVLSATFSAQVPAGTR